MPKDFSLYNYPSKEVTLDTVVFFNCVEEFASLRGQ